MKGEQLEFEDLAREIRRRAGVAADEIVSGPELIERVLQTKVRVAPTLGTTACLAFDGHFYRVVLREIGDDSNFDCAHELAHYALRTIAGYKGSDEERHANALAATILAPAIVVRGVAKKHGRRFESIEPLAECVQISQTAAHLRLGEILEDERAVLTKKNRHRIVRTQGSFGWKQAPLIKVSRGERTIPGLAKTTLYGGIDDGRIAFLASG